MPHACYNWSEQSERIAKRSGWHFGEWNLSTSNANIPDFMIERLRASRSSLLISCRETMEWQDNNGAANNDVFPGNREISRCSCDWWKTFLSKKEKFSSVTLIAWPARTAYIAPFMKIDIIAVDAQSTVTGSQLCCNHFQTPLACSFFLL